MAVTMCKNCDKWKETETALLSTARLCAAMYLYMQGQPFHYRRFGKKYQNANIYKRLGLVEALLLLCLQQNQSIN
jgi:hypothetical protein